MATAFVLSGGGSLGAVQVGMLQALADRGIEPDLIVGTSVGALNGAYIAGHGTSPDALAGLQQIWGGLRRADVFPLHPARLAAAAIGRAPSLCANDALRRLIADHVGFDRLEQATIPLLVVTTDVRTGEEIVLTAGDTTDAVLASSAIPSIYPSVRVGERDLIDGGIADNAAVTQAVAHGADVVYVLPTGYACALEHAPTSPLASALQALTLLIEQRLILEVSHLADRHDIRVLPPLCPLSVSSTDFSQGSLLVDRARVSTGRWLDEDGPRRPHPERFLSLHGHQIARNPCRGDRAA